MSEERVARRRNASRLQESGSLPPLADMVAVVAPSWSDLLKLRLRLDDPQTIGDLAEAMQAPRRAIEKAVEELRLRGEPIVSGPWGICLTRDPAVLRDNYRRLRARYIHQAQGARELLRTARRFEKYQQQTLWDVA